MHHSNLRLRLVDDRDNGITNVLRDAHHVECSTLALTDDVG